MPETLTAAAEGFCACGMDQAWSRALEVIERHILIRLRDASLSPADIDLKIEEAEHPERRGMPALRVSFGRDDTVSIVYLDWHGCLSWRRPRTWLDRRISREIARRRWIMAMVDQGIDPATALFECRSVHPFLRRWSDEGRIDQIILAADGPSSRFRLNGGNSPAKSAHGWHQCAEIDIEGLPSMDLHVDHDLVTVNRMQFSAEVAYVALEDVRPCIRLGSHRLPHTALFALAGQPLSDLIDSPFLQVDAMPVIDRMKMTANGRIDALLQQDRVGNLIIMDHANA